MDDHKVALAEAALEGKQIARFILGTAYSDSAFAALDMGWEKGDWAAVYEDRGTFNSFGFGRDDVVAELGYVSIGLVRNIAQRGEVVVYLCITRQMQERLSPFRLEELQRAIPHVRLL